MKLAAISCATVHVADAVLTYFGMMAGEPEGNPIVAFAMAMLGVVPGLVVVKIFAFLAIYWLYVKGFRNVLWFLAALGMFLAIIPWTLFLVFGI